MLGCFFSKRSGLFVSICVITLLTLGFLSIRLSPPRPVYAANPCELGGSAISNAPLTSLKDGKQIGAVYTCEMTSTSLTTGGSRAGLALPQADPSVYASAHYAIDAVAVDNVNLVVDGVTVETATCFDKMQCHTSPTSATTGSTADACAQETDVTDLELNSAPTCDRAVTI